MPRPIVTASLLSLALASASIARAGGGPAHVIVLYNADEPQAVSVANHYAAARSLPPGHLCPVHNINPSPDAYIQEGLSWLQFVAFVRKPFDRCLAFLPHPEDIDYVVVVKGICPRRVPGQTAHREVSSRRTAKAP